MDYDQLRDGIKDSSLTSEHYRRLINLCASKMDDPDKAAEAAKDLIDVALAIIVEQAQSDSSGGATT